MNTKILLVEDDPGVSRVAADLLRAEDYKVDVAANGQQGYELASRGRYDLLILDLMLPDLSGHEICRRMRNEGFDGAILMLTALGQVPDRVKGLNTGADDYVVKPFDPDELLARVASLLRRVHKTVNPVARIQFGKMTVDFDAGKFLREGRALKLTNKEIELLRLLVNHRGQPLSRDYILTQVWPEQPHITARTVDVHVAWLRQKVEDEPAAPRHILTVRGEGYQFER